MLDQKPQFHRKLGFSFENSHTSLANYPFSIKMFQAFSTFCCPWKMRDTSSKLDSIFPIFLFKNSHTSLANSWFLIKMFQAFSTFRYPWKMRDTRPEPNQNIQDFKTKSPKDSTTVRLAVSPAKAARTGAAVPGSTTLASLYWFFSHAFLPRAA